MKKASTITLIRYPRFNRLHEHITLCQEATVATGEPACMALEGPTGAGKSTLARAYSSIQPRYDVHDGTRVPIFYLETPSPVTVKGMASHMLNRLGDPIAHKGTLHQMNVRLIHYLQSCQVQLVILDDFHHLIDSETNRILARVSDWLKVLIKETKIPFLVVGITNTVETILQANQQLSRLFAVREELGAFSINSKENTLELKLFLANAQQVVGYSISDELPERELLLRIFYATNGVVANMMNLLYFAALLAKKEGEDELTVDCLNRAFNMRLQRHVNRVANPFSAELDTVLTSNEIQPQRLDGSGNRSRRRKKKAPTAAAVLRTR